VARRTRGSPDGGELLPCVTLGHRAPRRTQSLADPFSRGHSLAPGRAPDFGHFRFLEQYLEALAHQAESL
jgi:hypothetical protein